jgi:hypothetical protein
VLSDLIDTSIQDAVKSYDGSYELGNPFEGLLSMGELIDRLSIVNFKLYTLKNKVMQNEFEDFRAWAAEEDIRLVEERARLKRCIDEKIIAMIAGSTFNAESKLYD